MRDGDRGDRREKKTWKEIDALRDKSRQRDSDPQRKQSSPSAVAAAKSYRAALERAFEGGTLAELAKTLMRNHEDIVPPGAQPAPPKPEATTENGTNGANGHATATATTDATDEPPTRQPLPQAPPPAPKDPERENRMKLIVKIKEAEGRDAITRAIDAYLARYPKLPPDFEVLTKALSHKDDDRVRETLGQLADLLTREKPRRGRTLVAQLRFLEETHGDPEIRTLAAELRAKL
jgi:hypothetical protein